MAPARSAFGERTAGREETGRGRDAVTAALLVMVTIGASTRACAADLRQIPLIASVDQAAFAGLSLIVGLVLFSTVTALLHLAARRRWTEREQQLTADIADARVRFDRAEVFLAAEPQIIVAWRSSTSEPDIEGDLSLIADAIVPRRILGFGSWLPPASAQALEHAVERLRARGEGFRMPVVTVAGRHLEVEGRAVAGRAILRIRDVSGHRLDLTRLRDRFAEVTSEVESLRTMLDVIPDPAWMRDTGGRLTWVNAAYAKAVEAKDGADAVVRNLELLDQPARLAAEAARTNGNPWIARSSAVVAGARHILHVVEVAHAARAAGIAIDLSELEAAKAELEMQTASHARTLDQLSTAVAIFDRGRRLVFHNAAYRTLWSLDAGFLDSRPLDGEILDRLRSEGRLPEQVDYRAWRSGLMAAYHAAEPIEHPWYLPGGRTLRAVTNPNPNGGVTYLFDDITERYHLEAQYNALIRVQGETLDTLREGVAVFGTNGRLKLFNPAFADLWRLDAAMLAELPHVDAIARACTPICGDGAAWTALRGIVSGLEEARRGFEDRLARTDGTILDYAAVPLPDGATLLTFTNVTAGVNVERALTERNKALLEAEKIRNDFVHHVSYELRSPLTNIIGFVQLLGDRSVGSAQPQAARICRLRHQILGGAARDHQRHPRPGHHRHGRDAARSRAGRHPPDDGRRGGGSAGPPVGCGDRPATRRAGRDRRLHGRRQAGAAGALQPALQRDRLLAAGADGDAGGPAARRLGRLQGHRRGARHPERRARPRVRPLPHRLARLAPPGGRARPVDRPLLRGVAQRAGADRFLAGRGHLGHLPLPRWRRCRHRGAGRDRAALPLSPADPIAAPDPAAPWTLALPSQAATLAFADRVAAWLRAGDVVTLAGDLGAGKTTFARALIRRLVKDPALEVPSPTFTLMQVYDGPGYPIVHADLYRVGGSGELTELGWDDAGEGALLLVEWADRLAGGIARDRLDLRFALPAGDDPESRTVILTGHGAFATRLAGIRRVEALLPRAGFGDATRHYLTGDASTRAYERLTSPDGRTALLMISPPRADAPVARYGKAYHLIARLAADIVPFLAMDRALRAEGVSAPALYAEDAAGGLAVLEDLGAEPVVDAGGPIPERYLEAVRLLATLHGRVLSTEIPSGEDDTYAIPPYDCDALLVEVELLLDWYAPQIARVAISASARAVFMAQYGLLFETLKTQERGWVLRDFHSPNLIWLADRDEWKRIGVIDFQDCVIGHPAYDLVSLLQDARVTVPDSLELKLLGAYAQARRAADPGFDMAAFVRAYAILGVQRATKILGIFARLDKRDRKPHYLGHLPRIEAYLVKGLAHPALADVRAWFEATLPRALHGPGEG